MNIIICIKEVPSTTEVEFDSKKGIIMRQGTSVERAHLYEIIPELIKRIKEN